MSFKLLVIVYLFLFSTSLLADTSRRSEVTPGEIIDHVNVYKGEDDNFAIDLNQATGIDFLDSDFSSYGYPSNIYEIGNLTGNEDGDRCDFFLNEVIDDMNSLQSIGLSIGNALNLLNNDQQTFVERCGANGSDCQCDTGSVCTRNRKLNRFFANIEFSDRAPKVCLFHKTCKTGDKSQKQVCKDTLATEDEDQCETLDNKCYYTGNCLTTPFEKSVVLGGENEIEPLRDQVCKKDYNCSSGYCKSLTRAEIKELFSEDMPDSKLCMPVAECRPKCTEMGSSFSGSGGYCCSGAYPLVNGNDTNCVDPTSLFVIPPPEITVEFDDNDCSGGLVLSENGSNLYPGYSVEENDIITEAFSNRYARELNSLEVLWGNSDNKSPGANDWFGVNDRLDVIADNFSQSRINLDYDLLKAIHDLKNNKIESEKEANNIEQNSTAESASGISTIISLSNYNLELSKIYNNRRQMYKDLIGYDQDSSSDFLNLENNSFSSAYSVDPSSSADKNKFYSLAGFSTVLRNPIKREMPSNNNNYSYRGGKYNKYRHQNSSPLGDRVELCKNKEQEPIKGKASDWFGDRKNNSVCVKEMIKVRMDNNQWLELVDPVYPVSSNNISSFLNGIDTNRGDDLAKYSSHEKLFPSVSRKVIDKNVLKENIKSTWQAYADEVVTNNQCIPQKKSMDRISHHEVETLIEIMEMYLTSIGISTDISAETIEQEMTAFYGEGTDIDGVALWKRKLSNDLTSEFIYESFVGLSQQVYVKDGFTVWDGLNLSDGTALMIAFGCFHCALVLNTMDYNKDFEGHIISSAMTFFWGTKKRKERKYLNSVSYRGNTGSVKLSDLIYGGAWLENYSLARANFFNKRGHCLADKAKLFSDSFRSLKGGGTAKVDLDLGTDSGESFTEDVSGNNSCNSGGGGSAVSGYSSLSLSSQDQALGEVNESVKDNATKQLGVGLEPKNVGLNNNNNLGSGVSNPTDNNSKEGEVEGSDELGASLKEQLNKRNSALASIGAGKKDRLKSLGLLPKEQPKVKNPAAAALSAYARTPAIKRLLGKAIAGDLSVSAGKVIDQKALLKKKEVVIKKKEDIQEKEPVRRISSFGNKTYQSKNKQSSNIPIRALREASKKTQHNESDNLWESISKSYLKYGVPRLFEKSNK
jgi:hypothetical protein